MDVLHMRIYLIVRLHSVTVYSDTRAHTIDHISTVLSCE